MYRKLPLQQQQTIGNEKELKYRNPVIFKEFGNPTSLCFHGKKLFTGCSTRVQIYAGHELFKSVSLKDLVTSVDVRQDGRLFACGDNMGVVRVYDSESRSVLRTLVGHKGAVKNVKFMHQTNRLISASDDNTIILWDVTAETILQQYSGEDGHSDYVRGLCVSAASPHLFISGSYDHTLKLWDTNTNKCLLTLDHQHPVESLLVLKQMTILISTGGNKIKIWDLLTGKLIQVFGCHQKTVTSCSVDSKQEWLFTGSLDHQVKIISLSDYKVLKTIKYPNPVLCVMVGNNDQELAVGMTGGLLCVRNRIKEVKEKEVTKLKRGTYDYLMRGGDQAPAMGAVIVSSVARQKLQPYEKLLKSFEYGKSLDEVLKTKNPNTIHVLLDELHHRRGLEMALSNRNEDELLPILTFILQKINDPRYSNLLITILEIILDFYGNSIDSSLVVGNVVQKIVRKVGEEIRVQRAVGEVLGVVESMFIANETHNSSAPKMEMQLISK